MKGFWIGVMGLALLAPAGSALAQDGAAAPAGVQMPAPSEQSPDASTMPDAPASGETTAAGPNATGWEGPIPDAPIGLRTRLSVDAVNAWLAQPRTVLDQNPDGGRNMAQYVRSLAGSDNRTVTAMVSLVSRPDVNSGQVGSAAEGLASAMRDAENAAPSYAAYIQWAVAQSGSPQLIAAFQRASGADEDRTASIGAGGGGAGGGSPGSGSLSGAGAPGVSGPVGGSSTVPTSSGGLASRGGSGSVALSEGDRLLGGTSGRLVVCIVDASTTGCQDVF